MNVFAPGTIDEIKYAFKQAIDNLDSLITDNSSETRKAIKYQLLFLRADFLVQFRKMNEFKEIIELIETEYKDYIKIKFKEFWIG